MGMCAEHTRRSCKVCGKVAAQAKKRADRLAWLAVFPDDRDTLEMAADTGRIGRPNVPDVGLTVGAYLYPYLQPYIAESEYLGWDDTFAKITRRGQYDCLFMGRDKAKIVQSARGGSYRIDLPCEDVDGDCLPCRQYWVDSAVARFKAGLIGDTQLVITATGFQTPEQGQQLITGIGRQLGPVRRSQVLTRTVAYTYAVHIVVTGAMPLPAVLQQIRARPGVSAEYRPVSADDFRALLYTRTKLDLARCPVRFLHWPKAVKADDSATTEYAHNDGYVADAMDARGIPPMRIERRPSLKLPERQRVRLREARAVRNVRYWLSGVVLDQGELMTMQANRKAGKRHKDDWRDCIASGVYDGPKALIRDLAAALDDDGLVAFTERRCMMVAANHIGGNQ